MTGPGADALAPVRRALRDRAREQARALLEEATRDAGDVVSAARTQAEALLAAARQEGAAQGRAAARTVRATARRQDRERQLAARGAAVDRLVDRAVAAVDGLRGRDDYPRLVAGLADLATRQLGPGTRIEPDRTVGGLVARRDDRSVDYRLPQLARRCVAALGPDLEELWR